MSHLTKVGCLIYRKQIAFTCCIISLQLVKANNSGYNNMTEWFKTNMADKPVLHFVLCIRGITTFFLNASHLSSCCNHKTDWGTVLFSGVTSKRSGWIQCNAATPYNHQSVL